MKHLPEAIRNALIRHNMKQIDLAQAINIGHPEITRIMQGKRPGDAIFPKLCASSTWKGDSKTALLVLCGYLEDEVERAGRTVEELVITPKGDNPLSRSIMDDLKAIQDVMPQVSELREVISTFADMARKYHSSPTAVDFVVEPKTPKFDNSKKA